MEHVIYSYDHYKHVLKAATKWRLRRLVHQHDLGGATGLTGSTGGMRVLIAGATLKGFHGLKQLGLRDAAIHVLERALVG